LASLISYNYKKTITLAV